MERDAEHHGDDDRAVDDGDEPSSVTSDPEVPEADAVEQATPAHLDDDDDP